jgi:suppressor of fused protein SUFU
LSQEIQDHLANSWVDRKRENFRWTTGPIRERIPDFHVCRVEPLGPGDGWTYFSVGASEPENGGPLREFFLRSATESPRHVETLAMVSHFHSFPDHRFEPGSIVDIGRPWIEGSEHRHLMVSWPHCLDPRKATCTTKRGDVMFLWLVPIAAEEAAFGREQGVVALEDALEGSGVDLLDPSRSSTV